MSEQKTSRKQLLQEPDEFLSTSQHVWLWVHANQQKAAIIVGGMVIAVLAAVGIKSYVEHAHTQRSAALAAAVAKYAQASGGALPAELKQEFSTLAERYAGAPEGAVARYFLAGTLAAGGDTAKAREIYTALAAPGAAQADLALLARQSLAYLDLAAGNADAALAAFQELLKAPGAVGRAQILLDCAAIHEKKGRTADARRLYQELLAEHPEGPWVATAKERLRLLAETGTPAS
jgi:tetratricopeptide (TPR) repeat protein